MHARPHLAALGAAAMLGACAGTQKPETPKETVEAAAGTRPTDPQIVGILLAANDVDIGAGYQAERMASAAEVQAFGKQMVADHAALNEKGAALARDLGITPEESPTSRQLRENGDRALERRQALTGAQFDRTYLDDEIAFHAAVLQAIDEVLLPNAANPELKALITQARPHIAAHLEQARTLRENLAP